MDLKLSNIIIESDALSAVQSVEKGETGGCLGHLFHGIVLLLKDFRSWSINTCKGITTKLPMSLHKKLDGVRNLWFGKGFLLPLSIN